jgi:hypothetical protein
MDLIIALTPEKYVIAAAAFGCGPELTSSQLPGANTENCAPVVYPEPSISTVHVTLSGELVDGS